MPYRSIMHSSTIIMQPHPPPCIAHLLHCLPNAIEFTSLGWASSQSPSDMITWYMVTRNVLFAAFIVVVLFSMGVQGCETLADGLPVHVHVGPKVI